MSPLTNTSLNPECGRIIVDCSDEVLFAHVQQGDHRAFGLLVQRYQDRVYSIARKALYYSQDAQDAVQQAFLQAWQKRQAYKAQWRFRPWLYRIVANICIDEYRRQQRRQAAPQECLESLPAPDAPEQAYAHLECRRALEAALAHVPMEARMVLVLCYVDGLSYSEIARVRGISVQTVKSQLRRAKTLMRQRLEAYREVKP